MALLVPPLGSPGRVPTTASGAMSRSSKRTYQRWPYDDEALSVPPPTGESFDQISPEVYTESSYAAGEKMYTKVNRLALQQLLPVTERSLTLLKRRRKMDRRPLRSGGACTSNSGESAALLRPPRQKTCVMVATPPASRCASAIPF